MKIRNILIVLTMAVALYGCPAPLIFGGLAAGGVYSVTNDTISDVFAMPKEQAFETMVGVLTSQEAKITLSSIADGKIEATVGKSFVFVTIEQYNADNVKVVINAKKEIQLVPDKDTAVRIYRLFIKETTK